MGGYFLYLPYLPYFPHLFSRYNHSMKPAFLFIGLGNIGKEYESTRHNIGFFAADRVAKELNAGEFKDTPRFMSMIAEGEIDGLSCAIIKPTTYMNRSGEAVRKLVDFYKLDPATQLLMCCDDIDLPLGTHRLRMNGGPGTHNGLKSIVDSFGENFPRLRIGIGPKSETMDLAAWVLSRLTEAEKKALDPSLAYAVTAMREVMKSKKEGRKAAGQ